jgi:2'-5' RNA ligase
VRCFLSLEIPALVRRACIAATQPLRNFSSVAFVAEPQLHVTLRFLENVGETEIAALRAAVLAPWPVAMLSVHGLAQFPARGSPRVIWAGLRGDLDAVSAIARRLDEVALGAGVAADDRGFHPHITLGRCKSGFGGARIERAVRESAEVAIAATFFATRVVLYSSRLSQDGPIYTELAAGDCAAGTS